MQRVSDRRRSRHSPSDSLRVHLKEEPVWSPCYSDTIRTPLSSPPTSLPITLSILVLLSTAVTSVSISWTRAQKQAPRLNTDECVKQCVWERTLSKRWTAIMTSDVRLEEDYKLNRYVCLQIGPGCVCVCICSPRWRLSFYKSRLARSDNVAGMSSRAQNEPCKCWSHSSLCIVICWKYVYMEPCSIEEIMCYLVLFYK